MIPTSPNDMPTEWHNDERQIRNAIVTLDDFSCVDIHYERDHSASDAAGENIGTWEVYLETNGRQVKAKHPEITNALWYALKIAEAQTDAAYQAQQDARTTALAKLTTAEQQLLGLR
jgi:hypothetical protein